MSSIGAATGASLMQAVQVSVLREELDAQEIEGEAVLDLLEQSAEVLQQNGADPHLGQLLDTYL